MAGRTHTVCPAWQWPEAVTPTCKRVPMCWSAARLPTMTMTNTAAPPQHSTHGVCWLGSCCRTACPPAASTGDKGGHPHAQAVQRGVVHLPGTRHAWLKWMGLHKDNTQEQQHARWAWVGVVLWPRHQCVPFTAGAQVPLTSIGCTGKTRAGPHSVGQSAGTEETAASDASGPCLSTVA